MSELNVGALREKASAQAFRLMMWGFLFLIPTSLQLGGGTVAVELLPDAIGWALIVAALGRLAGLGGPLPWLRAMAVVGFVISLPRLAAYHPAGPPLGELYQALYMAELALAVVFTWTLAGTVAGAARAAGAKSVASEAGTRRWAYAAVLGVLIGTLAAPRDRNVLKLGGTVAFYFLSVCAAALWMSLMSTTARLCDQLRSEGTGAKPASESGPGE